MPPDVPDVAEVREQVADDRLGLPAVGALEVPVLDDGDHGVMGAADVVPLGIHGFGQVLQLLRPAEQRPAPQGPGQPGQYEGDEPGQDEGEDHGAEDADLGLGELLPCERPVGDEQGDREADAGDGPADRHRAPADRRAQPSPAQPCRQRGAAHHTERLADHIGGDDAQGDGGGEGGRQLGGVHGDARVGQGEHRDDHIAGPGVEQLLQARVQGHRHRQAAARRAFQAGRRLLPETQVEQTGPAQVLAACRVVACHEAQRQARHDRVHTRLQHREPDGEAGQRVTGAAPLAAGAHHVVADQGARDEDADRGEKRRPGHPAGVGDRDDGERDEVVDHGGRQHEGPRRDRQPPPHQGVHPQRERGVRGDHGSPAARAVRAVRDGEVDRQRHQHPGQARRRRQGDPHALAEFAEVELAPGLQAHDEEEQRHQAAVDPLPQVQGHPVGPQGQRQVGVPDRGVVLGRHVRPDQGEDRGGEQIGRARRLGPQEPQQRRGRAGTARRLPRCPQGREGTHPVILARAMDGGPSFRSGRLGGRSPGRAGERPDVRLRSLTGRSRPAHRARHRRPYGSAGCVARGAGAPRSAPSTVSGRSSWSPSVPGAVEDVMGAARHRRGEGRVRQPPRPPADLRGGRGHPARRVQRLPRAGPGPTRPPTPWATDSTPSGSARTNAPR